MRRNGIALVLVLIACHADPPRAEAQYAKPPPATNTPAVSGTGTGTGTFKPKSHGAAHYAQISEVAVSADGTAAITRDAMGGLRVWPALDGSLEPRIVPVASPAALSIERRADGIVAAIVDGSGAGHVVTINKDGRLAIAGLPIDPALVSLTVLPGGDRVLGVRADQSLGLYDTSGAQLDEASVRGMRIAKLMPRRDGARALALVTTTVKGKPGAAIVAIDATSGKLALGAPTALPMPIAAGVPATGAVSPKGARVAYLAQPAGGAVQLLVADATTGAEIKIAESPAIATPMQTAIGWTGDDKLYVVGTSGGWRVEFGATIEVFASAQAPRMTLPSFGDEAVIGGYGAHLAIERTDGTLRFLGYSELAPTAVSVAPSGKTVMWITSSGALMKEALDGSGEALVRTPNEWYGSIAAVDDHTALAGRNSGVLALVDMDAGKELATLPVSASTPFLQYSAKRKLVAVMAQAGVIWLVGVDRDGARPLGKPTVIADGAQTFQLLDTPDDGVLLTYDNAWKGRIYTAAELAKGVSAAQMKKDRFAGGGAGYVHDRNGQTYVLNGTEVQIWKKGTKLRTFQVETASAISASPDGGRVAVTTQSGAIAIYDAQGKKLWSVGAGSFAYGTSWSDDGALLAIATQGGGLVIDAATGAARVQSCGWKLTLDTAVPQILPQNVPTVCR
jgi:outer membrane protein assembly factor BamB